MAAINHFSTVVLIRPDGSQQTVLTAAEGLSDASAVAIRGNTVYLLSAAYLSQTDPNVLLADLHRWRSRRPTFARAGGDGERADAFRAGGSQPRLALAPQRLSPMKPSALWPLSASATPGLTQPP